MLIGARSSMMGVTPEIIPVEYIESTGTQNDNAQYIDTGVYSPAGSIRFAGRVLFLSDVETTVFGNFVNSTGIFIGRANSKWYSWHGSGTGWLPASAAKDTWLSVDYSDGASGRKLVVGGITYSSSGATSGFSTAAHYRLFGRSDLGGSLRIGQCQIYVGSTLVRDFIPVRVGQIGYMFDKVSGRLFGNSGTGAFVVGPDLVA